MELWLEIHVCSKLRQEYSYLEQRNHQQWRTDEDDDGELAATVSNYLLIVWKKWKRKQWIVEKKDRVWSLNARLHTPASLLHRMYYKLLNDQPIKLTQTTEATEENLTKKNSHWVNDIKNNND